MPRLLREGRWIAVPAILVTVVVGWYQLSLVLESRSRPRIGDGRNVETYEFTLEPCLVDRDLIAASGRPRDGLPRLDHPPLIRPEAVVDVVMPSHAKYLVSADRVVGVAFDGVARAYPLRVLAWHEVVNDTVGGVPVCVTYAPRTESVVVFDRTSGPERLGFSGLVYNANLLLHDDVPGREPSLWSQLQARAVAGPAAARGDSLTLAPFVVTHWATWVERHPGTTVIDPDPGMVNQYRTEPYGNYAGNDLLPDHPVRPVVSAPRKAPVAAIVAGDRRVVVTMADLRTHAGDDGRATIPLAPGTTVGLAFRDRPPVAWPTTHGDDMLAEDVVVIPAYRFAWFATHPDDPTWTP